MSQLDFYGTNEDVVNIVDFMFSISPMKLYESYSPIDSDIFEFNSGKDIIESSHLSRSHNRILVTGWWETVTKLPAVERYKLNPSVGSFRHTIKGVATFCINQEGFNDLSENSMKRNTIIHWDEAGARDGAYCSEDGLDEINWKEFRRLSGKLHRHVKNKMGVAKLGRAVILPGAWEYLQRGGKLWGYPGVFDANSQEIIRKCS